MPSESTSRRFLRNYVPVESILYTYEPPRGKFNNIDFDFRQQEHAEISSSLRKLRSHEGKIKK